MVLMASSSNWCIGGCWVIGAKQNKEILFLVVYVYACYFILVFVYLLLVLVVGCSLPCSHHFFLHIYSKVLLLETLIGLFVNKIIVKRDDMEHLINLKHINNNLQEVTKVISHSLTHVFYFHRPVFFMKYLFWMEYAWSCLLCFS